MLIRQEEFEINFPLGKHAFGSHDNISLEKSLVMNSNQFVESCASLPLHFFD
jgi:hypothetical protein